MGKKKKISKLEKATNLKNKGLISVDRGTKATLTRTIPRSEVKSFTKDLSLQAYEIESCIAYGKFHLANSIATTLRSWKSANEPL